MPQPVFAGTGHFEGGPQNGPNGPWLGFVGGVGIVAGAGYRIPRRATWATAAERDETLSFVNAFAT